MADRSNEYLVIRPAGMTYERALEIAIEVGRRKAEPLYSDDIIEKVRVLHGEGVNDATIGRLLKIPYSTTHAIRVRLGLEAHISRPGPVNLDGMDLNSSIRALVKKGLTDRQMGESLGVPPEIVKGRRLKLGLPVNRATPARAA